LAADRDNAPTARNGPTNAESPKQKLDSELETRGRSKAGRGTDSVEQLNRGGTREGQSRQTDTRQAAKAQPKADMSVDRSTTPSSQMCAQQPTLASVLRELELERYLAAFEEEEVDSSALLLLDERDLSAMGIKIGPRKKLAHKIAQLQAAAAAATQKGKAREGAGGEGQGETLPSGPVLRPIKSEPEPIEEVCKSARPSQEQSCPPRHSRGESRESCGKRLCDGKEAKKRKRDSTPTKKAETRREQADDRRRSGRERKVRRAEQESELVVDDEKGRATDHRPTTEAIADVGSTPTPSVPSPCEQQQHPLHRDQPDVTTATKRDCYSDFRAFIEHLTRFGTETAMRHMAAGAHQPLALPPPLAIMPPMADLPSAATAATAAAAAAQAAGPPALPLASLSGVPFVDTTRIEPIESPSPDDSGALSPANPDQRQDPPSESPLQSDRIGRASAAGESDDTSESEGGESNKRSGNKRQSRKRSPSRSPTRRSRERSTLADDRRSRSPKRAHYSHRRRSPSPPYHRSRSTTPYSRTSPTRQLGYSRSAALGSAPPSCSIYVHFYSWPYAKRVAGKFALVDIPPSHAAAGPLLLWFSQ
jgi:hypothetical protein